ncbi:MAG: adenylate cyclase, partial [Thermoleophilales bacterium]|nr:adenylate cyclase [Thermoleophilales bacterium]
MSDVDWEKEGLLEGVEGEERDARAALLDELHEDGVGIDELREAVREQRLTLLPVERVLGDNGGLTTIDVAEQSGLDVDVLRAQWQALGLPRREDDERAFGERDVQAAKQLKAFLDAGLPLDGIMSIARVMGEGMGRTSNAVMDVA